MKKFLFLLTVSIFFLAASCSKGGSNGPGEGPDLLLTGEGYLVTMGLDFAAHTDTLVFWWSTSGQEMTLYGYGFGRPQDYVIMSPNGDGSVTFSRKVPYVHTDGKKYNLFGIQKNPNPSTSDWPNNPYLYWAFYENKSEETSFIIKRNKDDKDKFSIESKAHPGYFLGVAKWKNATYPIQDRLVFTAVEHEFWFVDK